MAAEDAAAQGRTRARRRVQRTPAVPTPAQARLVAEMVLARGALHRYGEHREQHAELYLPGDAGPHPVVVLIHGGSWHKRYGKRVTRALARDLRRRGLAVWNIEYRRLGNGGGWPHTFADVAAAIDHLRALDAPLDLARVSVVGHSAGGHLALWAAGRARLEPGTPGAPAAPRPPGPRPARATECGGEVRITRAVALAGVCDLEGAYRLWRGGSVRALLGGSPEQQPERFTIADPMAHLPLQMPVLLVHGVQDTTVSVELSRSYARAAAAAGASVELVELAGSQGDHRAHIDPRSAAWRTAARWLEGSSRTPDARADGYAENERASATSSRTP